MPNGQIIASNIEVPNKSSTVVNAQYLLLDGITATDPGIWLPFVPFRNGSFEVTSPTSLVGTIKLYVSNAAVQPANAFQITLGDSGSITPGDVITITISCGALSYGDIVTAYTVQSTDTTLTILATSLAAAITAQIEVALRWLPGQDQNQNLTAANLYVTHGTEYVYINWLYPIPPLSVTYSLSAGATETVAIAAYDYGQGFLVPNCSVTAVGNVAFNQPATWIKALCSAYTSGTITAIVQATAP